MGYCINCGEQLRANASYCTVCGTRVFHREEDKGNQTATRRGITTFRRAAIIGVVLIIVSTSILFWRSGQPAAEQPTDVFVPISPPPSALRESAAAPPIERQPTPHTGYLGAELIGATRVNDVSLTDELINRGADVNARGSNSETPLHVAAFGGYVEIASILMDAGADVDARNDTGKTPLHLAASRPSGHMATLLISRGANVQAKDSKGYTPLHVSVSIGDTELTMILLNHGADLSVNNDDGVTPLHLAALLGQSETAELLIDMGANIDVPISQGFTALHHAVILSEFDIVKLLVERGANMEVREHTMGGTPLHFAALRGYTDIVRVLLEHGADVNALSHDMYTPLSLALMGEHQETAVLLEQHGAVK